MQHWMALALSGGVDSSVAALILHEKYDHLVGASHFIWPDSRCCSVEAFNRAKYICQLLHLPYYVLDLSAEFKARVVDNFIATYGRGLTPNPCVLCNEQVRFTLFYQGLKQKLTDEGLLAKDMPLFFATGHYVQLEHSGPDWFLKKARDKSKDQSYMLYRLPKDLLPYFEFPLGTYLKKDVIRLALEHDLSAARVRESQDACFVQGDYAEFITAREGYRGLDRPGDIADLSGKVLGRHKGYLHYTVGQRSGLGLGDGPWYVVGVEAEKNLVVVGRKEHTLKAAFLLENLNWFIPFPDRPMECLVKIRYQGRDIPCTVEPVARDSVRVTLSEGAPVTPGQSAVFYRDDLVLGGGIITKS